MFNLSTNIYSTFVSVFVRNYIPLKKSMQNLKNSASSHFSPLLDFVKPLFTYQKNITYRSRKITPLSDIFCWILRNTC